MIRTLGPVRFLEAIEPRTWALLHDLGLTPEPLPAMFASATAASGRTHLAACRWRIGPPAGPLADGRLVRIQGVSSEIVNTMIFPAAPEEVPVFAAELLVFGGCPRLVFIDLQVPGLATERCAQVAALTRELTQRYAHLPGREQPPTWAIDYSTGGYFFARPDRRSATDELLELYAEYLQAWRDVAASARPQAGPAAFAAARALREYKQRHLEHSPGRDFLAKVFGADWAYRFLHGFLYQ